MISWKLLLIFPSTINRVAEYRDIHLCAARGKLDANIPLLIVMPNVVERVNKRRHERLCGTGKRQSWN